MLTATQRKILRKLCKRFNMRYRITPADGTGCEGYADVNKEIISITNRKCTISALISICLHEICHILAHRDGKFRLYHNDDGELSEDHLRAIIRTGWRAEAYVDNQAEQWMELIFPDKTYIRGYYEADRAWYDKHYLKYFRDQLQQLKENR